MTKTTVYIGSVDQGTTSSRFLVFDHTGAVVASHQAELKQHYPQAGWHEHDPHDILQTVKKCMNEVAARLDSLGIQLADLKAIGITNQRETTICWDAETGEPLYNAIVWCDARTKAVVDHLTHEHPSQSRDCIKDICGLPLTTYFSGVKLKWMLDNVPAVQQAARQGRLRVGTVDSWLIYHLTGGHSGQGRFVTDVTNASRTMLMDVRTLAWSEELCRFFGVSISALPEIRSSSEVYGHVASGPFAGIPLSGCLGDQQAAMVGQKCFTQGEAKNTYGTGCFMLFNTGTSPVISKHGLLTTVGYQLGPNATPVYALEGSIAVAGAALQWLRDNLGIIASASEIDRIAGAVPDNGGVYFVPAFSGLFAPYWRDDARGCIVGLTHYANKHHIARATLEATCFQTHAILDAMNQDSGVKLLKLKVDGGMTNSDLCMQLQADLAGIPVERPAMRETTALGAAMAAGLAIGIWKDLDELSNVGTSGLQTFQASLKKEERERRFAQWNRAVQRSLDWIEEEAKDL
ncbi:glycerol kinase [Thamnocephalis sphaerospora]|uniref:Probable glycerol kinase n=1 Tax=Thamnocephalis sphaerospora TaxID=78915 RepID=A0A4P9XVR4_9FUNG|nr:glycerol kinase [Thamnocephalis sphaerospora]|eukprot:RKP10377.1 glycerol kinase [Thamnocephalis sphaerospora]